MQVPSDGLTNTGFTPTANTDAAINYVDTEVGAITGSTDLSYTASTRWF